MLVQDTFLAHAAQPNGMPSGEIQATGTEHFIGCLDLDADGSSTGDPSGSLAFTYRFSGKFDPVTLARSAAAVSTRSSGARAQACLPARAALSRSTTTSGSTQATAVRPTAHRSRSNRSATLQLGDRSKPDGCSDRWALPSGLPARARWPDDQRAHD